jgi:hypothetical protein
MRIIMRITAHLIVTTLLLCIAMHMYGMNLLELYNPIIRPLVPDDTVVHAFVLTEFGIGRAKAWDAQHQVATPLHIWQSEQRGLQMLEGFPPYSPQTALLTKINANNADNRGNLCLFANMYLDIAGGAAVRYFFFHDNAWSIAVYLPFYRMRLTDLSITDLTPNQTPPSPQDFRVRTLLTDPFKEVVFDLGQELALCDWIRTGVGDCTVMLEWRRSFPQAKPVLREVALEGRLGVTAPSGLRTNDDLLMALPFGYDGAFAIPFGFTLEALLGSYVILGFDIELTQIFGRTASERIRTARDQTDLVLLQTVEAYRNSGFQQQYSLYAGVQDFCKGLRIQVAYQYRKHGRDNLCQTGICFSDAIANTAESLKDWTVHEIIARADYDFAVLMPDDAVVTPGLELFVRFPFNGKRAVAFSTVGLTLSLNF